jgi:hypothetical protein
MHICKCPACQAQFQAPEDRVSAVLTCPDCRFLINIPNLKQVGPAAAAPDLITCECPACRIKFQVSRSLMGTDRECPECKYPVYVPAIKRRSGDWWLAVIAITMIVAYVLFCSISTIGSNANSAFGTVYASIGATVTAGPPAVQVEHLPMPKVIP